MLAFYFLLLLTSRVQGTGDARPASGGLPAGRRPLQHLGLLDPFVREDDQLCNVKDGCLSLVKEESIDDCTSTLGPCQGIIYTYQTSFGTRVELSELHYQDGVSVYRQFFPQGLKGTSNGDKDGVCTGWPVFQVPSEEDAPGLRFITPGGYMNGWTLYAHGDYKKDNLRFRDGESGGIVILAQSQGIFTDSVIMTALKQPMAINVQLNRASNVILWGVQGQADGLPPGYEVEVVTRSNSHSVVQNILGWGQALKDYFRVTKLPDFTSDYLGYWTDNGAAHYYNPGPFGDYEELLLSIHNYSTANDIPFRYLQLDSWWYFKGLGGGIKNWAPMPSIFPNGIEPLFNETGMPILAHNRYFSSDTDYAIQNGGVYAFTIDESTSKSLPLDKRFWDDLFDEGISWGLRTYEQDWLDRQYEGTSALHTNVTLSSWWLDAMGSSAEERNLNLQYCMAFPRHFLHSVALPAVTQIRVSDDYMVAPEQWRIGVSSLFAHALGLKPFKDVFWTSPANKNVIYSDCENITPVDPDDPIKFLHQYTGFKNVTVSGLPCLEWKSFDHDAKFPHGSLRMNLCRNPDEREGAYCYTKASYELPEEQWEWEFCRPPICDVDCYTFNGELYEGTLSVTESGKSCVDWKGEFDLEESFCRNPTNESKPWCYVAEDHSQRESCSNKCTELTEHNVDLHAAVSTLSAGPVGIGDRAENLNRTVIMKSCNNEGLILKPSKPLTVTDIYFMKDVKEVWTSTSIISKHHFGIIFLAETTTPLHLTPLELNLEEALQVDFIIWQNYPSPTTDIKLGAAGTSGILRACDGYLKFCLYYTAPRMTVGSQEVAILGEWSKWTPVSPQRIQNISILENDVQVKISGIHGEDVQMMFWSSKEDPFDIMCDFNQTETMTISVLDKSCS